VNGPCGHTCMCCKRPIQTLYCYLWAMDSKGEALTLRLCGVCWSVMVPQAVHRRLRHAALNASGAMLGAEREFRTYTDAQGNEHGEF
jgi:hypothetical protein